MRLLREAIHLRWRRDLSAYVDGHLEPLRREALDNHLAVCLRCHEELAALRKVVALLHQVPQVEVPRSFALLQAPSAGLRWPTLYGGSFRYATAVAAVLLLAVVVGDLVTGRPTALAPGSPGVAETTTAPAAGALQDIAQATPSPQPLPFAASEKAQETVEAGAPPSAAPDEPETLHDWYRRGEIALGALLAALVTVAAVQWWLGRRQRHG